jgi:hypothetical protein
MNIVGTGTMIRAKNAGIDPSKPHIATKWRNPPPTTRQAYVLGELNSYQCPEMIRWVFHQPAFLGFSDVDVLPVLADNVPWQ